MFDINEYVGRVLWRRMNHGVFRIIPAISIGKIIDQIFQISNGIAAAVE